MGFQVVPGLSIVGEAGVPLLQREGLRVVFLVDSDRGGESNYQKLIRAGIDKTRILRLSETLTGLTLEDLIAARAYVDAVNGELKQWQGATVDFPISALPNTGRARAVQDWCSLQGLDAPSKTGVAGRLLERSDGTSLVEKGREADLVRLYASVGKALELRTAVSG